MAQNPHNQWHLTRFVAVDIRMDPLSVHTLQIAIEQLAQRDRLIQQLQQTMCDLHKRLAEAKRADKRSTVTFSIGALKENTKKPGRKRGKKHGKHGHRTRELFQPALGSNAKGNAEAFLAAPCPTKG